jgi:hypothetical protein
MHMAESFPVEGLFDNIKLLPKLAKWLPVIRHLSKLPEFWGHLKKLEFDKAGDLFEASAKELGYEAGGKAFDDFMDALEGKNVVAMLRSVSAGLMAIADLLEGKAGAETIRFPAFGSSPGGEMSVEALAVAIDQLDLDQPATVSASDAEPVENPMLIIGIAGLVIQGLKFIWEWKKSQK